MLITLGEGDKALKCLCYREFKCKVVNDTLCQREFLYTSLPSGSVVVESQDVSFLMKFFCNYAFKWEGIATALHFQHGELQNIKHSSPIAAVEPALGYVG